MLQAITEEAKSCHKLVFLALRDISQQLGVKLNKLGQDRLTRSIRHRAKEDTTDLHDVGESLVNSLDVFKELFNVFLCHLLLFGLKLLQSLLFIELDCLNYSSQKVDDLNCVLGREPCLSLEIVEVLDAS